MRVQALLAATILSASMLIAPTSASAEGYGRAYPSYHDAHAAQGQCEQQRRNRTATGAAIGGVAGAVLGSGVSSRGARTEGSILAGVLGAAVGAMIARGQPCAGVAQGDYDPYAGQPQSAPYGRDPYNNDRRTHDRDGSLYGGPSGGPVGGRDCEWRDDRRGQAVYGCTDARGVWRPE